MYYLLDIHHKPPMVVLASDDKDELDRVGQTYANQVSRPLVVATGPHPDGAHFKPHIPTLTPADVVIPPPPDIAEMTVKAAQAATDAKSAKAD
jgi:hypothetical protein